MVIKMLDASTLGTDMDLSIFKQYGDLIIYNKTDADEVEEHITDADILILNKVKLNEANLKNADKLKLICITATGFDNVDTEYCKSRNIAVCNIKGYSTDSVAQLTATIALSLIMHLNIFDRYVKDRSYTKSGVHNCLTPVFHEIKGMTWGIVGMGAIGRKTAEIAKSLGAEIIAYNRTPHDDFEYVGIEELCRRSDIISLHLPLNEGTKNLINSERIDMMKKSAILINVARGAVVDENAVTEAVLKKKIAGFGSDVYSVEPMQMDSAYNRITDCDNVFFTPHLAWGTYEARVRCIDEVSKNIYAFLNTDKKRNRIV